MSVYLRRSIPTKQPICLGAAKASKTATYDSKLSNLAVCVHHDSGTGVLSSVLTLDLRGSCPTALLYKIRNCCVLLYHAIAGLRG